MTPPTMNGNGHVANTSVNATENVYTSADDGHIQQLWSRYETTKHNDQVKNLLLEDVLTRYDYLIRKHHDYVEEHKQERELAQKSLEREKHWYGQAMHLQRILNRDPYILVLIDGDGMIFNDNFLKQGEIGGKQAACLLHNAVSDWAAAEIQECPQDVKVVARIYANLKGLGDVCTRAGIISSPDQIREFAGGFTRGKKMFDFTDVGAGKDRADAKIIETFKLYLYDYHCRQVLFACSHDNGYARLLEQYIDETETHPRFTMLEGVPFEKELQALPFRTKKFPGIFRESKIMLPGQMDLLTGPRTRVDSRVALNATSGIFTPRTTTPTSSYSPFRDLANHGSTASSSPTQATGIGGTTWASLATKNAHKPLLDLPRPPPPEPEDPVKRNRKGQRLDIELEYDRDEVQRIKKLKSCNQHYIGIGCCHFNAGRADKCPHSHDYNFSARDLKWLQVVARETPCKRGHACDDPKCIYGHQCPFPIGTEGSTKSYGCLNGQDCRFPETMHGMDNVPVKLTRVTGLF